MHCQVCRLTWDTNDPEPPPCGRTVRLQPAEPLEFASGLPFDVPPRRATLPQTGGRYDHARLPQTGGRGK